MAFVSGSTSPDQDPNAQQTGNNPLNQQAPITSAPPAGTSGKAAVTPSNTAPTQPFTNLQTYLSANAPQIQQEGQNIAGGLQSQYGQVTGNIAAGQKAFADQTAAGYVAPDQSVIDAFNANPVAVAGNPDQAKTFTGMYGDTYKGPANFETSPIYGDLTGQVQQGVQNAQNLQTPAGISSYFSSTSPNYTQGMGTLDAALLQGNPDVVANIQAAAAPFKSLPDYLSSVVTGADQGVATAQQQAQAAKAAAQAAMTGQVGNLNANVNAKTLAAQKQAQDYNAAVQAYQAAIGNDIPQANQIKSLAQQYGITFNDGQPPMIDPNSITAPNVLTNLPTAANVASAQDYATLAALEALSGGPVTSPITDATAGLAGSFKDPGKVDNSALMNALFNMQQWAAYHGNNAHGGDVNNFVPSANAWYLQLLENQGYKYPGTGPRPGPFTLGGTTTGGGTGLGGPGTPGGV